MHIFSHSSPAVTHLRAGRRSRPARSGAQLSTLSAATTTAMLAEPFDLQVQMNEGGGPHARQPPPAPTPTLSPADLGNVSAGAATARRPPHPPSCIPQRLSIFGNLSSAPPSRTYPRLRRRRASPTRPPVSRCLQTSAGWCLRWCHAAELQNSL